MLFIITDSEGDWTKEVQSQDEAEDIRDEYLNEECIDEFSSFEEFEDDGSVNQAPEEYSISYFLKEKGFFLDDYEGEYPSEYLWWDVEQGDNVVKIKKKESR